MSDLIPQATTKRTRAYQQLVLVLITLETQNRSMKAAGVKVALSRATKGTFNERQLGFPTFRSFLEAAATAGYVEIQYPSRVDHDVVIRPVVSAKDFPADLLPAAATGPLPSLTESFDLLYAAATRLHERGSKPYSAAVKVSLVELSNETFREVALGFATFREFITSAAAQGYVRLDPAPVGPDVIVTPIRRPVLQVEDEDVASPHIATSWDDAPRRHLAYRNLQQVVANRASVKRPLESGALKTDLLGLSHHFSETRLGFNSFREFLSVASALDYIGKESEPATSSFHISGPGSRTQAPLDFRRLHFGFSSAAAESVRAPHLLLEGFYDVTGAVSEVRDGDKFLILGFKGSGKSAIAERLWLQSRHDPTLEVQLLDLRDFPFGDLAKLTSTSSNPDGGGLETAWSWLLLLKAFESLLSDEAARYDKGVLRVRDQLIGKGLLASGSLRELTLITSELKFTAGIPKLLAGEVTLGIGSNAPPIEQAVQSLRSVVSNIPTDTRHLLILDGLDELLTPDGASFKPLAALINQVDDLNADFARSRSAVKIVVLCRVDLFEKLPSPNKNKIRQDFALSLDWYSDRAEPDSSSLLKLIGLRATLGGSVHSDIFTEYFPPTDGFKPQSRDIKRLILEHTRHTPRDLINALAYVQEYCISGEVDLDQMWAGLRDYSINYFVPELKDELTGYLEVDFIEELFRLLGAIGHRAFPSQRLYRLAEARDTVDTEDLRRGLQLLYDCSAIGNVVAETSRQRFRFRTRNSSFNPDQDIILHRGTWSALDLD